MFQANPAGDSFMFQGPWHCFCSSETSNSQSSPVAAAAPFTSRPQLWQDAAAGAAGVATCQRAMAAARLRSLMLA